MAEWWESIGGEDVGVVDAERNIELEKSIPQVKKLEGREKRQDALIA